MTFTQPDHRPPEELMTGFMGKNRPALGSVVAKLRKGGVMPPYVQLASLRTSPEQMSFPGFLGAAHQPFIPGKDLASLTPGANLSLERLENRRRLLLTFDRINEDLDAAQEGYWIFRGSCRLGRDYATGSSAEPVRPIMSRLPAPYNVAMSEEKTETALCMSAVRFLALSISVLVGGAPSGAHAQGPEPRLMCIFPLGTQRGTMVEVTITGTNLQDARGLVFSHAGISARPLQPNRFAITTTADVPEGDYDVWAVAPSGMSNPRRFAVGALPEVNEKEKNDEPKSAQVVQLPIVINGSIQPGTDRDYYQFELSRGQRLTLSWRSETLEGSVRPALTIIGPTGGELLHDDGRAVEPVLDFQAPDNGNYLLRVEERAYRGDTQSFYRLALFSGPRLVAAFPHVLTRGKTQPVTFYGYQLPGGKPAGAMFPRDLQTIEVSVPAPVDGDADGGGWTLASAAFMDGFRYRHPGVSGVVRLGLVDRDVTLESSSAHATPASAQPVTLPCAVAGRFVQPREVDWYRFAAKKGQALWIETVGERDGKVMDLDLAIHDAQGKVLLQLADTIPPKESPVKCPLGSLDPMGDWQVPADGEYFLMIRDLYSSRTSGVERTYRLSIEPRREAVRVVAIHANAAPSGFAMSAGGGATLQLIAIRRGGHEAPIRIRAQQLPPSLEAKEAVIPAKQLTATYTVAAAKEAIPWVGKFSLMAETEIDGKMQTISIVPLTTVREGVTPLVRRCDGLMAAIVGKIPAKPNPGKP